MVVAAPVVSEGRFVSPLGPVRSAVCLHPCRCSYVGEASDVARPRCLIGGCVRGFVAYDADVGPDPEGVYLDLSAVTCLEGCLCACLNP